MSLSPGFSLNNRYRIIALLGQGGMGAVYDAQDTNLGVRCAVKENLNFTEASRRQFEREARLLAELRHPNLPRVTDHFLIPDQGQYLVMDFVEGENLDVRLARRGRQPEADVLRWADGILSALAYLHKRNIIHRDIKPANIIIASEGEARLVDFGIAKEYDAGAGTTTTGARGLTPGFASPEQYGFARTDVRSDVFSFGATLYALLAGDPPTDAWSRMAEARKFVPLSRRGVNVSPAVAAAIDRALEMKPEARFASAEEMRAALTARPTVDETTFEPAPLATVIDTAPVQTPRPVTSPPAGPAPTVSPARPAALRQPAVPVAVIVGGVGLCGLALAAILAALVFRAIVSPRATATPTESPSPTKTVTLRKTEVPSPLPPTIPHTAMPAPTATLVPTATLAPGATQVSEVDGMVMVLVTAGEFEMGGEVGRADERPIHSVYVDAFWIDRTEVTNAQFAEFVRATGYQTEAEAKGSSYVYVPGSGWTQTSGADWRHPQGVASSTSGLENHPVVHVSWNDTVAYCAWAGRRLPTEAEWEKAARGPSTGSGDGRTYPWGNQKLAGNLLNFADRNSSISWADKSVDDGYELTAPVGSYPKGASPYGALDMAGNVWEWVADWYGETYYSQSPLKNPQGPSSGEARVVRGGSWYYDAYGVRAALRSGVGPTVTNGSIGFRCARGTSP